LANEVIIRKAASSDMDAITDLWQELMDFHYSLDPQFNRSPDSLSRFMEFISSHIKSDSSCVFVAEEEGRSLAGYCLATLGKHPAVFERRDYGIILELAVTGRRRRQGIGENLYRMAEAWFADLGIHRIEVQVAVSNEVSASFWWKMDFAPYITTEFKNI
jgi:ribosomal protein S18 acetylase RimI-like enzyme